MNRKRKIILAVLGAVLLALVLGCGAYVSDYYRADEAAAAALVSTETVTVEQRDSMTVFIPEKAELGFLFYPGGKVEYTAYAPLMMELAERNILCVLLEMPCNLAVLDMDAAEGIPARFPEVERWYIGGHSLGGSMAASFAAKQTEKLEGLVLLAAYSTADLTRTGLKVISLYGSEDGVLNMEKYQQYRENLPSDMQETIIEGGNHSGFGGYGHQEGDGEASVTAQVQIRITAEQMTDFFSKE